MSGTQVGTTPIYCGECDCYMSTQAIANLHFNSAKHLKKMKSPETKHTGLCCTTCKVSPGSLHSLISHMASAKHLKKVANIPLNIKEKGLPFNIQCDACETVLTTNDEIVEHCKSAPHIDFIKKTIMANSENLEKKSPFYCDKCDKKCNSKIMYDTHCKSYKHLELHNLPIPDDLIKEKEKRMEIPEFYECKICNLVVKDKKVIDSHYLTAKHKERKKARQVIDEYKRVAEICKKELELGDIGPQIATGKRGQFHCDDCDIGFNFEQCLSVHNRGRIHIKCSKTPISQAVTVPKGSGYHCNLCNVHTTCPNVFKSHISGKAHASKLAQQPHIADVPNLIETPASSSTTPTTTKQTTTKQTTTKQITIKQTTSQQNASDKAKKSSEVKPSLTVTIKTTPSQDFSPSEEVLFSSKKMAVEELGLTPENQKESTSKAQSEVKAQEVKKQTFSCKVCNITCPSQNLYEGHIKGKKHLKATLLPTPENKIIGDPEVMFFCKPCNCIAHTGDDTMVHLLSEKHKENSTETKHTIKEYFCKICSVTCKAEAEFAKHMIGARHKKAVRADQLKNAPQGNAQRMGNGKAPALLECKPCSAVFQTKEFQRKHLNSAKHQQNISKNSQFKNLNMKNTRGSAYGNKPFNKPLPSQLNKALAPQLNKPLPPALNRALAPAFNRTLTSQLNKALPPQVNKPLPPALNRALPSQPNRALAPQPNRALAPQPNRALAPQPTRGRPLASGWNSLITPKAPVNVNNASSQQLHNNLVNPPSKRACPSGTLRPNVQPGTLRPSVQPGSMYIDPSRTSDHALPSSSSNYNANYNYTPTPKPPVPEPVYTPNPPSTMDWQSYYTAYNQSTEGQYYNSQHVPSNPAPPPPPSPIKSQTYYQSGPHVTPDITPQTYYQSGPHVTPSYKETAQYYTQLY